MSKALNIIWGVVMFMVLFSTYLIIKPESQIAQVYGNFRQVFDGLILLKILILFATIFVVVRVVSKNLNKWSEEFRIYNLNQAKKAGFTFFAKGYEQPWMKYHSKAMILFGAFMAVVLTFAFLFGPVDVTEKEMENPITVIKDLDEEKTSPATSSPQNVNKPIISEEPKEKNVADSTWKTYSYADFSIQFPAEPKTIDESTPGKEFKTYIAPQEDGTAYFLTEMDIPQSLVGDSDRQTLMNAASIVINQAKQSADVNIDYAVDTTNEIGYPSIEFKLAISEGPRVLYGQYILVRGKMYQMRVVSTVKSEKNVDYRSFFSSFDPKS